MAGILDQKTGLLTQAPEGTTINETGIVNRPITSPTQPAQPNTVQVIPTPNTRSQISETPQSGYIQGYDTNQNYKPVYVPKGVYVPGISPTPKEMTTNSLQNSGTIKLPNVDLSGVSGKSDPSGALTAAEQFQADYKSYQEKLKSLQTAEQQKATSLDTQIASLIGDTAGLSDFESQQRSLLEDPLNKQLTSINNQITALMAEKERFRIDQEGKPITLSSITGSVAQNNAKLNGEILTLTAQASALQGNIALAEQQVTQAVNAKYGPALEALKIAQAQRDSLTGTLTKQEAEQKAFLDIQSKKEVQNIADKKEKEKAIQMAQMAYFEAGGTDIKIANAISKAPTVEEAQRLAGMQVAKTIQEDRNLEIQLKKAQLSNIYSQIGERDEKNQIVVDASGKLMLKPEESLKISKELVNSDAYKAIKKGQDSLQYLLDFEKKFKEVGLETFPGKDKGDLASKYTTSLLNLKEFFNLGVLNGPDLTVLEGIMPNPTKSVKWGPWGILPGSKKLAGVKSATTAGIETLKSNISKTLDDRYTTLSSQYGDYSPQSLRALGDLQRIYIQEKASLDPKVQLLIDENPGFSNEDIIQLITQS